MIWLMQNFTRSLVRWLLTLLFTLVIPVVLLRLLYKSIKNPEYRRRWLERFGIFKSTHQKGGIWVHMVSLGEAIAAVPLIRKLQNQFPNLPITVTTSTPTGSAKVINTFGTQVFHVYFPYDLAWSFDQFIHNIQPKILVLMETELWPNCLWACQHHQIPVVIMNGRLSPRSMIGYLRIHFMTRQMLGCVAKVAAQSEADGARFIKLGLDPNHLEVTGNIKFDLSIKAGIKKDAEQMREIFGSTRPVWIAASTHSGEEAIVLDAFVEIRNQFKDALLILVPRHPERFESVGLMAQARGFSVVKRSNHLPNLATDIWLGDTMGELLLFYAASDVAFVGGSFVPIGGHNTLEPAAVDVPVIVGPHVHNFVEITKFLSEAGALVQVQNSTSLAKAVINWFAHPEARKQAGMSGKKVVEKNRGAVDKMVAIIQNEIATGSSPNK